jgi:hypothetical protein
MTQTGTDVSQHQDSRSELPGDFLLLDSRSRSNRGSSADNSLNDLLK